jgi:hypothetical protein
VFDFGSALLFTFDLSCLSSCIPNGIPEKTSAIIIAGNGLACVVSGLGDEGGHGFYAVPEVLDAEVFVGGVLVVNRGWRWRAGLRRAQWSLAVTASTQRGEDVALTLLPPWRRFVIV